jgi:histidine triad (HIT) family protein
MNTPTLFERILTKEIPAQIVYEDEYTLAFHDISPQAPVHVLVIPKKRIVNVKESTTEDVVIMGHVLFTSKKVAEITGIADSGYRLVLNNGADAGQSVFYMHCHVLGGRPLEWPPG